MSQPPRGAIAIFELDGPILALYPRTELAKDANIPIEPPTAGGFSIGHIVASKADVDALLERAQAAGATVTDQPHIVPGDLFRILSRSRRASLGDHLPARQRRVTSLTLDLGAAVDRPVE
jgi:hypothetical protein